VKVAQGYAQLFPEKGAFTLDLEFKKLQPGVLQVRQVREISSRAPELVAPIVLNEPTEFIVLQTEFGDAFAFHRLKSVLATHTLNTKLRGPALVAPLHRKSTFDFVLDGVRAQQIGGPFGWPGYQFKARQAGVQNEQWKAGTGAKRVTFRLRTSVPTTADVVAGPVVMQRDFTLRLTAIYKTPQPYLDFVEGPKMRTSDSVTLIPRDRYIPDAVVQTRRVQTTGGVVIEPRFYWPDVSDVGGFVIIKTLPLAAWDQTTITGLTTEPLVLTDYFAQTYAPGHHNFVEVFLFEPALDPNVTTHQRAELESANIRLIHLFHDRFLGGDNVVQVLGYDGKFRTIP
jgi:hypothetical protein